MRVASILRHLAACLTLLASSLSARPDGLRFRQLNSEDGLSNNWVRCFYQDDEGFVWVGTSDGMDRYDGEEFVSRRPSWGDEGRPHNVTVNDIARKDARALWVGTDDGLFVYDRVSGEFAPSQLGVLPAVLDILPDSKGRVWFSTSDGLFRLDPEGGPMKRLGEGLAENGLLPDAYINVAFEDAQGAIWIGAKGGLSRLDPETGRVETFPKERGRGPLDDDVLSIAQDRAGRLWIASPRGGVDLVTLGASGPTFTPIEVGRAVRLLVDRDNMLWVGKASGGGLLRFDLDRLDPSDPRPAAVYRKRVGDSWSISEDSIFRVYEDDSGDIWVGTFGNGISYASKRGKPFEAASAPPESAGNSVVNAFWEDARHLWIGTNSGLVRQDRTTGANKVFRSELRDETTLGADPIFAISGDSRGNLWVGGWTTGLNRYDPETETFRRFMPSGAPGSIPSSIVFAICEDRRGNLWIGTLGGGLARFDYETETFERFQNDPDDPTSISNDNVEDILEASDGSLYLAVHHSLDRFDPATGRFKRFPRAPRAGSGGEVEDVFQDSRGQIWLATTSGLELFDPRSETFVTFGASDDLPPGGVQSVVEDADGHLWIGSTRGLTKFENGVELPAKPIFRHVAASEGLSAAEFKKRAAFRSDTGYLYFGASRGYTRFRPEEIRFNSRPPRVALTGLKLLQTSPDAPSSYRSILQSANAMERFELDHDEASFVVSFAALDYLNPEMNRYRYKLEGYDRDWIDAGQANAATYTSLPPGSYRFHVLGSNNDGAWSTEAKTLAVLVRPPWWGTVYFRGLVAALAAAGLFAFYRLRFALLRRQKRLLAEEVRARTAELSSANALLEDKRAQIEAQNRELSLHRDQLEDRVRERTLELEAAKLRAELSDQLKSSFLTNMSHEIRTPMNAIIGFSSLLAEAKVDEREMKEFVRIIGNNGRALLVLIDDILDISLLESRQLALADEDFVADDILLELLGFYRMKQGKPVQIEYANRDAPEPLALRADPVRFRQIMSNLLNNAYKFTDAGIIRFGYERQGDKARFFVEDTGAGIGDADLPRVFEHFFKAERDSSRLYPGTGIGLSICRSLVALMGGEIWADSELGKGSTFHFTMPLRPGARPRGRPGMKPERVEEIDLAGVSVLIAEDDEVNRELARISLEKTGAALHWAKDGREAVAVVEAGARGGPWVVLMDIKMPRMNGYDACRRIKEQFPDLPVVAVTAYAQTSERERILAAGFDDYLSKPVKPADLRRAVQLYATRR